MASSYKQATVVNGETHFTNSPTLDVEYSRMVAAPRHVTAFNGGDIVPVYCREILPGQSLDLDVEAVIRQTTMLRPVFGELYADIYAFFVPNRVVNESWVNVMGENSAGAGIAPDVTLAPLVAANLSGSTLVPVGSVADYYGFPTQAAIPNSLLAEMHDLKFRGYLAIYNEFFRDQNYQPPIPFSKLNIFEDFFASPDNVATGGVSSSVSGIFSSSIPAGTPSDGSFYEGAVVKALYGEGSTSTKSGSTSIPGRPTLWSALSAPLKANKLHDFFTSILPYPQKGLSLSIMFPSAAQVYPLKAQASITPFGGNWEVSIAESAGQVTSALTLASMGSVPSAGATEKSVGVDDNASDLSLGNIKVTGSNLAISIPAGSLGTLDISNLRTVIATQQVFEVLARAGSRYREMVQAMFGISADDPYKDIPEFLGHVRRTLNNYQVAQTSPSVSGGTAQANLAAYGYTATGGKLFSKTFLEHGYVHVFCVVRQKNLYSTILWQDNFRRSMLDFYMPPLANISEQPVRLSRLNPFAAGNTDDSGVLGYQEAWAEYRYEPDQVSGVFREGIGQSLSSWLYLDEAYTDLEVIDGAFMQSNAEAAINPTLAINSSTQPQFFAEFVFKCDKTLPMPVYSVPGLDIF